MAYTMYMYMNKVLRDVMVIAIVALLVTFVVHLQKEQQVEPRVGNDADVHGCIPSAGYTWCEAKQKCLREWEEQCVLDNTTDTTDTTDTTSGVMSEADARSIAEVSCIKGGESLRPGYYNENSRTWWFDANLNATKPGCNPACVVSSDTRTAEINWRCTGAVIPKPETAKGHVTGTVSIGPICPVEREGVPCEVPAEVYTSRSVVVYDRDGVTVLEKTPLTSKGTYDIALKAGTYWIQIEPAGIGPGEKKQVTISDGTVTLDFDIDTGIR